MKILWIAPYPNAKLRPELVVVSRKQNHSSSWIVNLSNELAKRSEVELHIITHYPFIKQTQKFKKNNIVYHVYKYNFPFTYKGFPSVLRLDIFMLYKPLLRYIYKVIKEVKPDLIHVHGTENGVGLLKRYSDIPTIISIQGVLSEIIRHEFHIITILQILIEQVIIKKHNHFGCRTKWDSSIVRKINPTAEIHYLPEAINPIFYNYPWNCNGGDTIIYVGSIIKRKGIELLIDSLPLIQAYYPNLTLKVIGVGKIKYLEKLKKRIKSLHVDDYVRFMGHMEAEEIAYELSIAKIFVLPTYIDNSPNTLLEAMACGIPCVASNVGGIPSMIQENYDGLLFENKNINDLVSKVLEVLNDSVLQKTLSENSKIKIQRNNKPEVVADITITKYQELIKRNV